MYERRLAILAVVSASCAPDSLGDRQQSSKGANDSSSVSFALQGNFSGNSVMICGERAEPADPKYRCESVLDPEFGIPAGLDCPCFNFDENGALVGAEGAPIVLEGLCPSANVPAADWVFSYTIFADQNCVGEEITGTNFTCFDAQDLATQANPNQSVETLQIGANENNVLCITENASKTWDFTSCAVTAEEGEIGIRYDCGCVLEGDVCVCGEGGLTEDDLEASCVFDSETCDIVCGGAPEPGQDVVVFNDIEPFRDGYIDDPNNQLMAENLVNFTSGLPRDAATVVLMDRGHGSVCGGTGECGPPTQTMLYSIIEGAGLTVEDIASTSGSLTSIDSDVKVVFLWNPTVAYTVEEVNALKAFAAEGGRVVFVGEWVSYYSAGIPIQNQLLLNLGAVMTNTGMALDCGDVTLPEESLRPHQITTGMTGVTVGCSSVIEPGPSDFPLYYDSTNTFVLAGVATIDITPISELEPPPPVMVVPSPISSSNSQGT